MTRVLKNIALVVASSLVAVVCAEVVFRAWLYNKQQEDILAFERIEINTSERGPAREVTLVQIIQPTSNPRLIYELKPDMVANFMGVDVETNQFGFRGSEHDTNKGDDILRIVGVGDSHMFGWGVEHEASYLSQVGKALNVLTTRCRWEVVNTAVPGYNTAMEVEALIEKGLKFSPDLVIIQYVSNDLMLPNFLRRDYWNLKRSFLLYFLYDRLHGRAYGREFLDYTPHARNGTGFESDPALVPSEYKEMVGIGSYNKAMRKLKDLAEEHHFGVFVFTQFQFPPKIKGVLESLKMKYLEGVTAYTNYMARQGIDQYLGSALSISGKDPHPSNIAHRLQAEALVEYLQEHLFAVNPPNQELTCADISQRLQRLNG